MTLDALLHHDIHLILVLLFRELKHYLFLSAELFAGFAVVMAYLRYTGRTQFMQMNAIDMIGSFILGGLLGGIFSSSMSFYDYIVSLVLSVWMLGTLNYLYLHSDFFHHATVGDPIPVIKDGKFLMESILAKNTKVDILNITSQLNLKGILSFRDVAYAQIEPDGSLTVVMEQGELPAMVIVYAGGIRDEALKIIGKTVGDLFADMKIHRIDSINDIFLAEYVRGSFRYICKTGHAFPQY
ncbi:DUF421 domain-containing protein [Acetobacteraceae bacterium]|nr:DUF421 domain-containing protein [Acetobacteraceae bacterium]